MRASEILDAALQGADSAPGEPVPVVAGVLAGGERRIGALGAEPDARLRIASLTKPMTTLVALRLGVGLDAPLDGEAFSLRDCLTHTTGLDAEWDGDLGEFGDGPDALARFAAASDRLARLAPPGAAWGYCNAGYWLAGTALARAGGKPFEELLHELVFEPLGMRDAVTRPQDVPADRLVGGATGPFPRARVPSGGVISTAADLLAFAAGVLDGFGGALDAAREPTVAAADGVRWGLGWSLNERGGRIVQEHNGHTAGYRSHLAVLPETGDALVLLLASEAPEKRAAALDAGLTALTGSGRERRRVVGLTQTHHAAEGVYARVGATVEIAQAPGGLRVRSSLDGDGGAMLARPVGPQELEVFGGPHDGAGLELLDAPALSGGRLVRWDRRLYSERPRLTARPL